MLPDVLLYTFWLSRTRISSEYPHRKTFPCGLHVPAYHGWSPVPAPCGDEWRDFYPEAFLKCFLLRPPTVNKRTGRSRHNLLLPASHNLRNAPDFSCLIWFLLPPGRKGRAWFPWLPRTLLCGADTFYKSGTGCPVPPSDKAGRDYPGLKMHNAFPYPDGRRPRASWHSGAVRGRDSFQYY